MYGEVPPVTEELAVPFVPALHETFVEDADAERTVGCVTVVLVVAVHPFASVTV